MRRGVLFPLAVAAVSAALALLLSREQPPSSSAPSSLAGPEGPAFFLEDFEMIHYDAHGRREALLRGEAGEHYRGRGALEIERPRLTVRSEEEGTWHAAAPRGIAERAESTVHFPGEVELRRPAQRGRPPLSVVTRDLTVDTAAHEARTAAEVVAREPAGRLRGVGMTLDYRRDRLELHHQARGTYEVR
ncbi:LPS export ABC transporter periplasmic protein LptC [Halorhodospira neutriphila]|uniref:LPS export ABC transporter periplasmic protein LptC n=1 Tax=Halorhodospira neutriphila TaxID=168379 RepID=A0ABS1E5R4_9GAMM|nr:LPS export ABC transporter periplasmic protein LptC [Halorhodospira neutriphila]